MLHHFGLLSALLSPPLPNNPEKQNFEKKKVSWRYYHFTLVYIPQMTSYDVCFLRYGVRQI